MLHLPYIAAMTEQCCLLTEQSLREERIKLLELAIAGATHPACYDVPHYRGINANGTWHLQGGHSHEKQFSTIANGDGLQLTFASNL